MLKATLRNNDKHMITTSGYRVHIDGHMLAVMVADSEKFESPGQPLTKKAIEEIVRDGLTRRGREHYYFCHEKYDEEDWSDRWDWAVMQVQQHYPEMAKHIGES